MASAKELQAGLDRLIQLAEQRQLPAIQVSTSEGTPALKVVDTTFVRLADPRTAVLQCPNDQKVLLMEISPDLYFETDDFVGQDAMLVRLDRISDEELSLRLHDAWEYVAPQRLKKDVD